MSSNGHGNGSKGWRREKTYVVEELG